MQIIESKYRAEDVRKEITSILTGKKFILERCASFFQHIRQIRDTEIGVLLIAVLAIAFIYFKGLYFWQYKVFYGMCAFAFVFVIFYGRLQGSIIKKAIGEDTIRSFYGMTDLYRQMNRILQNKRKIEKVADDIKAEFAQMSEDEIAYVMAGAEQENRKRTSPQLENGQLRFDILDETIDRLYEGVRLWADIAEKSRRVYER